MKKTTVIISTFLLLSTIFTAAAQQNESWKDRSPYEVTIGTNLGTRYFSYGEYQFGKEDKYLLTTNTLQTPSINLGFTYKLSKRVTVGAIATYAQSNFVKTALYDNAIIKDDVCRFMSLAPRVRFDWLNRDYITLYSSFALGVGLEQEKDRMGDGSTFSTTGYVEATYLGIKVGRTFFGFADLSISSAGAMRIGVGYNFKSKK